MATMLRRPWVWGDYVARGVLATYINRHIGGATGGAGLGAEEVSWLHPTRIYICVCVGRLISVSPRIIEGGKSYETGGDSVERL